MQNTKAEPTRIERRSVLVWAIGIVLLASIPYMVGLSIAPQGYHFLGLTQNIDDGAVYLSWTRQAADGNIFIRNLFTNEPQPLGQINLLFLIMGNIARFSHLSCITVYHLFRVVLGFALIFAIWKFSVLFIGERRERLLLIPLVGLSSGIGWLIPNVQSPVGSVDVWQPEAITFLSIYLNPLFLCALLLMLGSFYYLILAERAGRARFAVLAGIFLLLLGNIHSYDVLTIACVWLAYVLVSAIIDRRIQWRVVGLSALAAAIGALSILYQIHIYLADPVFRARANTQISSPVVTSFFTGYGLVLLAAIAGIVLLTRCRRKSDSDKAEKSVWLFVIVWAVVGFMVPYIPIMQQRKLIMGVHIPLCILAAVALSRVFAKLKPIYALGLGVGLFAIVFQSNSAFMRLDIQLMAVGKTVTWCSPFISNNSLKAIEHLRAISLPESTIMADPQISLFVPGFAGRQVYYGHWSETPEYNKKAAFWAVLMNGSTPPSIKGTILRDIGCDFIVFQAGEDANIGDLSAVGLQKTAQFGETIVCKVIR